MDLLHSDPVVVSLQPFISYDSVKVLFYPKFPDFWNSAAFTADSHIACRAHAVPLPRSASNGIQCVFPIWFTQSGRVWFTLAMSCPCYAPTMPFFSRPQHSTSVERRPVGYLPAFGFFRLPRGIPRSLLSDAYQSQMQVVSVKPNTVCHWRGKEW